MRRRDFLAALGLAVISPKASRAQQPPKRLAKVGALIGFAERDPFTQRSVAAFVDKLSELGWSQGNNLAIEFRYGGGNSDKNKALAKELVGLQPDVIFVNSTSATAATQRETRTIPVVFATVSDPIGSGFVTSLARPDGNITGFVNVEATIAGKWVGLLRQIGPDIRTVGLMYNPATATYFDYYVKPFEAAAQAAGVSAVMLPVGNDSDIEQAFATRKPDEGIVLMSDPFVRVRAAFIHETAIKYRIPVVSGASHDGSLISYAPDTVDLFRRSAAYVDKILRGASPADLPVQLPTKFELIVNLKMARALGLSVPQTLLAEADEVTE